jgi:hypothetical protein
MVIFLGILPGLDGLWGNIALQSMCADAKTELRGKVDVPKDILGDAGNPPRIKNGDVDWPRLRPYARLVGAETDVRSGLAQIRRGTWEIIRVSDGVVLARQTNFYYDGSRILRSNGQGLGAESCIATPPIDSLLSKILTPV